ncbi:MAG: gamma-glutamylcyclotransferase family protein [Candidatus Micrarchaeia archaeon]
MLKMPPEKILFFALVAVSLAFVAFLHFGNSYENKPLFVFAYGGNLDKATFISRAGGFENAAPARLDGYRLVFQTNKNTEFGVANVVKDAGGSVPGVIYTLNMEQGRALDKSMGVPYFYGKISTKATLPDGTQMDVETYALAGEAFFAPPSRPTVEAAAKGLAQAGYGSVEADSLAKAAAEAGAAKVG